MFTFSLKSLGILQWKASVKLSPFQAVTEKFYTDKKDIQIFLIYKEIHSGAVAKSYMTNGLLIYGEIFAHHSEFPYIWGKFYFLFYKCIGERPELCIF